jgi:hypothetical protein
LTNFFSFFVLLGTFSVLLGVVFLAFLADGAFAFGNVFFDFLEGDSERAMSDVAGEEVGGKEGTIAVVAAAEAVVVVVMEAGEGLNGGVEGGLLASMVVLLVGVEVVGVVLIVGAVGGEEAGEAGGGGGENFFSGAAAKLTGIPECYKCVMRVL